VVDPTTLFEPEIKSIAKAVQLVQVHWPDSINLNISGDAPPSLYDCHPYLFAGAYPALPPERLHALGVAARLFASAAFLADRVLDDASPARASIVFVRASAMQHEAYRLLHELLPPQGPFWDRFRHYVADHARAVVEERRFVSGERPWAEYTETLALDLARKRAGLAKATVAALADLSQESAPVRALEESIDLYNIAFQMLDDLRDWRDDLQLGWPSLLLARLMPEGPRKDGPPSAKVLEQLARKLYYRGHAAYVLELAITKLDQALQIGLPSPGLAWNHAITLLRKRCRELLADIRDVVGGNEQRLRSQPRVVLPRSASSSLPGQRVAWSALDVLLRQWRQGFGEARHLMVFAAEQGFTARRETQAGDVFARALIADSLCDAAALAGSSIDSWIAYEADYLLSTRRPGGMGGWSYFPDLPELPPDADDLAQIMQVLLRAGRRPDVTASCEPALGVLLRDGAHPDGSFETWIIPATGRNAEQQRQAEFVGLAWGLGADSEVMANLLYALALYDRARFTANLAAGSRYIESRQNQDGSWSSSWYHGPFYGVHVCLRLLGTVLPTSPAIARGRRFLREAQRSDGGWGYGGDSDPLNTALALLGLSASAGGHPTPDDVERGARGLTFLEATLDPAHGWADTPLIRMELGRASGPPVKILHYGSRTVTAAFVLKAACAWSRVELPALAGVAP